MAYRATLTLRHSRLIIGMQGNNQVSQQMMRTRVMFQVSCCKIYSAIALAPSSPFNLGGKQADDCCLLIGRDSRPDGGIQWVLRHTDDQAAMTLFDSCSPQGHLLCWGKGASSGHM